MANSLTDMKQTKLEDMDNAQLMKFIDAFEIKGITSRSTPEVMVKAIEDSGKYTGGIKESGGSVKVKDGKRFHPTLGEYIKCKVHSLDGITDIHVGIGMYTADFNAGTIVHLPRTVIDFLKTTGTSSHYYDPVAVSENGTLGVHVHEIKSNYVIDTDV